MTDTLFGYYRLVFTVQLLLAELLFFHGAKRRSRFIPRILTGLPVYFAFSMLFPDPLENAVITSTIIFLASLCLMLFCYEEPWQHALFLCVSADLIQNVALNLTKVILILANRVDRITPVTDILVTVPVYAACYFLLARQKSFGASIASEGKRVEPKLLVAFAAASIIVAMNTIVGANGLDNNLYCRIILLCAGYFILVIQYLMLKTDQLRFEKSLIEKILLAEREQYQISKTNVDLINMKYHDIKHQIIALKKASPEERATAIREIENAVSLYDSIAKTGDETLDTILTEKMLFCYHNQILLTYIVDSQRLSVIQPMDLYSLFGNALDNAIESVMKAPVDRRVISLRVAGQGNITSIHLENYCSQPPEFQNGVPLTTKTDKDNHGFGVKSICYLVEKYHGNVSFFAENGMFALDIMIPAI